MINETNIGEYSKLILKYRLIRKFKIYIPEDIIILKLWELLILIYIGFRPYIQIQIVKLTYNRDISAFH